MLTDLKSALRPAFALTVGYALLLGLAYPLALTGVGQALFPAQANGSLITANGKVIGSELIGQGFASDRYFHGRPRLRARAMTPARRPAPTSARHPRRWPTGSRPISPLLPLHRAIGSPDLVTSSASGLDPHISPEAAFTR